MNNPLLSATLLNPALPATAPWAGRGPATDGGPAGAAFSRALEGARQSPFNAGEPQRPPTAPPRAAEAGPRGGERSERAETSERSDRAEESGRSRQGDRAERSERDGRAGRSDQGASSDRADSADGADRGPKEGTEGRRPAGAPPARQGDTPRRASPQAAARREGGAAAAESPPLRNQRGTDPGDEDSPGLVGTRSTRARPGDGTAEADPTAALAASATATQAAPGEAGGPAAALPRGAGAPGTDGAAEAARGGLRGLALRDTGSEALAALSDPGQGSAGRTSAAGSAARRPGDDAAVAAALDAGALGLRAALAEATTSLANAEATGRGESAGAATAGAGAGTWLSGPFAAALTPTASTAVAHAAGVPEAGLAAAPGSEAFARELGAQVSVFVREGVQQARLHLNPQELGPVLVRIQLEGQAAQVHLAADLPQTRQALEQALPALASQLSESGITLTGGGVFERPPQGSAEREARGSETPRTNALGGGADAPAGSTAAAPEPARWSRPRGLVDLIA